MGNSRGTNFRQALPVMWRQRTARRLKEKCACVTPADQIDKYVENNRHLALWHPKEPGRQGLGEMTARRLCLPPAAFRSPRQERCFRVDLLSWVEMTRRVAVMALWDGEGFGELHHPEEQSDTDQIVQVKKSFVCETFCGYFEQFRAAAEGAWGQGLEPRLHDISCCV